MGNLGVKLKIEGYWLASGILGVTGSVMKRVGESGADAIVTKSIGRLPRKGHPGPVLTTSHGGLINAVGLTNPGIEAFEEEVSVLKKAGIPVILSVFGSSVKEVVEVAEIGHGFKPDAIELNLSCPHAEIAQIAHSPKLTSEYVTAVKESVDCQVFAKLTPNTQIEIYNSSGIQIRKLEANTLDGGYEWNLLDNNMNRLPSGVYIYRVFNQNESYWGKFAVVQ